MLHLAQYSQSHSIFSLNKKIIKTQSHGLHISRPHLKLHVIFANLSMVFEIQPLYPIQYFTQLNILKFWTSMISLFTKISCYSSVDGLICLLTLWLAIWFIFDPYFCYGNPYHTQPMEDEDLCSSLGFSFFSFLKKHIPWGISVKCEKVSYSFSMVQEML